MIRVENLVFAYPSGKFHLGVERFVAENGSSTVITGPSGSGKTTLLHVIAGLLPATSGVVEVEGKALVGRSEKKRRAFRRARIGLVFQDARLVDYLSVRDNILVAAHCDGWIRSVKTHSERAGALADRLGISHLLQMRSDRISHGEAQRVAIARALLFEPPVLLADEPTASLDDEAAQQTVELLVATAREHGTTLVMASHDPRCSEACEERFDIESAGGRS
jgi:ABC-type lipoprotein export system ATPase subunit